MAAYRKWRGTGEVPGAFAPMPLWSFRDIGFRNGADRRRYPEGGENSMHYICTGQKTIPVWPCSWAKL